MYSLYYRYNGDWKPVMSDVKHVTFTKYGIWTLDVRTNEVSFVQPSISGSTNQIMFDIRKLREYANDIASTKTGRLFILLTNGNLIERIGVTSMNPFSKVIGINVDSLYDGDNTIIGRRKDGIFYKIGGKLNNLWS